MLAIDSSLPQFFDLDGTPLSNGKLYFGVSQDNPLSNPITVYWDAAGTQPAAQPIRTMNGYAYRSGKPATIYASGDYSMLVTDLRGRQVFYAASAAAISNSIVLQQQISDLNDGSDVAKGDAGIAVHQPFAGAITRSQHLKNLDFISEKDFGATGDGVTNDAAAILLAEGAGNDIYMPPGTYKAPGPTVFTKRHWGAGVFDYSGIGNITFTGSGLNNLSTAGVFNRPWPMVVWVEIVSISPAPETWRWSPDGGVTWITQDVTIDPVTEEEIITPLTVTTSPWPLGQTGVTITFGSTSDHAVGARWTIPLRPNPKVFEAGTAITMRGQLFAHCDGNRSWSLGQGNMSSGFVVGFENGGTGIDCLKNLADGYGNVFHGVRNLEMLKKGFFNFAGGIWALRDMTEGQQAVSVGTFSSAYVKKAKNTAVYGVDAATCQAEHEDIVAIGTQALHGDDTLKDGKVYRVVAIGTQAAREGKNLQFSVIVGPYARANGTAGDLETALGYQSLINSIGNANTASGGNSGVGLFAGNGNSFYGAGAGSNVLQKNDASGSMALGRDSFTTKDNQIVIGTTTQTETITNGHVHPNLDNTNTCGTALARWSVVYAATGSINTSDERLKEFADVSEAERRVALRCKGLIQKYRWKDAIELKSDGARWHFGVGAQSVQKAFVDEGLDAADYGLFCYDEWEDEYLDERLALVDSDGKPMFKRVKVREAGNRYGVRYDELSMFILAAI